MQTNIIFEAYSNEHTESYEPDVTLHKYAGRKKPVSIHGEMEKTTYTINYTLTNRNDINKMRQLTKLKEHLLFRDDRGRIDYIIILDSTISEQSETDWADINLTITTIDHNPGDKKHEDLTTLPIQNIPNWLQYK